MIRTLGKPPENTQEFVNKGVLSAGDVNSSCIYDNKEGGGFGPRYQLCFQGDSLQSKNAYSTSAARRSRGDGRCGKEKKPCPMRSTRWVSGE